MALTPQEELEQLTDEDRADNGSRFSDVVDVVFANPYQLDGGGSSRRPGIRVTSARGARRS
jgi:hypothetical protein